MNKPELSSILSLPANPDEIWEGGIFSAEELFEMPLDRDAHDPLMIALWRSSSTEMVHASPIMATRGDRQTLLAGVLDSLLAFQELHEFPFRPATLRCNDMELTADLAQELQGTNLSVEHEETMPEWERVLDDFVYQFEGRSSMPQPSLAVSGCSHDQLRAFAKAAASFYRARIWYHLDDVDLIQIESPKPPNSMRFAVVLGAAAETYGLGFYADDEDHYDIMAQRVDPREWTLMSLTYESVDDVSPDDRALWKKLSLPLETDDAFPTFHGFSAEGARCPTAKELEFATLVLQGLAQTTEEQIDAGVWTKSIDSSGKKKRCKFAIPNLTNPPDRREWMRRGLMPERREHERHMRLVQSILQMQISLALSTRYVPLTSNDSPLTNVTVALRAPAMTCTLVAIRPSSETTNPLPRLAPSVDSTLMRTTDFSACSIMSARFSWQNPILTTVIRTMTPTTKRIANIQTFSGRVNLDPPWFGWKEWRGRHAHTGDQMSVACE